MKVKAIKTKTLSIKLDLNMIRLYLRDIINDHKTQREWRIQLKRTINFISSKDSDETHTMHTTHIKNHNIEIKVGSEIDDIIKEYFKTLLQKYQEGLGEKIRGSEFVFHNADIHSSFKK